MPRGQRIFLVALVFSLLAHLVAAGSSSRWWTAPAREIPFPIETRINLAETAPVKAVEPAVGAPVRLPVAQASATPIQPPVAEVAATPVGPVELVRDVPLPAAAPPPQPADEPVVEPVAPPPGPVIQPDPPLRAMRNLPERIALRYNVQSGEDGFGIGLSTYSGWLRGGRYSLTSVTEATGITAMFVSGKITQHSEGSIGAEGLQPDKFWGEKGQRMQSPVRFEWTQKRLMLPSGDVDLPDQTQDLLSFPFHLAIRVREDDAAWELPVTNGKKLRNYRFQVIGRETLVIAERRIEALRVQGSRSGEGSLDVWLAPDRQWLPVRIRTQDQKGKVIVLTLLDDAG
jgi:hypothetical protein